MPRDPNCTGCRLQFYAKHKCVWGVGKCKAGIMLIGEAPGKTEDEQGTPFVGQAGDLLDDCLAEAGLTRDDVYITNTVKCRPPSNDFDFHPQAVEACSHYLDEEIQAVKPKLIVVMGNHALERIVGYKQITKQRGKMLSPKKGVDVGGAQIMATVHPAYALRRKEEKQNLADDLSIAARLVGKGSDPGLPKHEPIYLHEGYTETELRAALKYLEPCGSRLSCDLEWTAPKKEETKVGWPWSRVDCGKCESCKHNRRAKKTGEDRIECEFYKLAEMLAISFSGEKPDGTIVSVAIAWPAVEPTWLIPTLNEFMTSRRFVYHNGIADGTWKLCKGLLFRPAHDTMALTYNEDEEEVRSLEAVATKIGKILPAFKHTNAIFKSRDVVDWDILLERVAADTYATFILLPKIEQSIDALPSLRGVSHRADEYEWETRALDTDQRIQIKRLYTRLTMPMIPIVTKMTVHGTPINIARMDEAIVTQTDELKKITAKLSNELMLEDEWVPASIPETWKLLNYPPRLLERLNALYDLDLESTNKTALSMHQDDYPTLLDVREYRHIRMKLLGTYLKPWRRMLEGQTGPIGWVHSQFGLWTRTGRTSAKSEMGGSLHQIPHEEWLRSLIEAPPGYKLTVADNSMIELRILAWLANDEHMLELFRQGVDLHQATAAYVMYALPKYHMPMDEFWNKRDEFIPLIGKHSIERKRAKPVNFGFAYMQQPLGFVDYARTSYGLHFTLKEATMAHDGWMMMYPQVQDYFNRAQKWYDRQWCITPLGRMKRHALCVDYDTEILTTKGWVKGNNLTTGHWVLTKNPATNALEWQMPSHINQYPDYDGDLIELKGRSFSAVATPDHRWLVYNKAGKKNRTATTNSFAYDDVLHKAGTYGSDKTTYKDDRFIKLIGWVLTDGGYHKNSSGISIYQAKQENFADIEEALACVTTPVHKRVRKMSGGNPQTIWSFHGVEARLIRKLFPHRELDPLFLTFVSSAQLCLLLDTMIRGDGHVEGKSAIKQGHITFAAGTHSHASAAQMLAVLCGWATSLAHRKTRPNKLVKNGGSVWVVSLLKRRTVQVKSLKRTSVLSKGVWCPTVPNGFFVARRDGFTFITGNSAPEMANFPIQATASDFLSLALIEIDREMNCGWSLDNMPGLGNLFAEVHDSSMTLNRDEHSEECVTLVRRNMERPPTEKLGLDFNSIPVPFATEVKTLQRWEEES